MLHHYIYPAIFYKCEDEIKVLIPDLNITTEGNSFEEAYLFAKDYLRAYCTYAHKFDMEITFPSKFDEIFLKNEKRNIMLLDAIIDDAKL